MSEEGDDSPPRPKRKIKKVVIVSSSESESDASVGVAETRRKRLRIISDGEASDSSGSSVVCAGTRRRKILPKLRDSETESDSSGWGTDQSATAKATNGKSMVKPASGFASDSSEDNSDKCSICLLHFKDQEIGTPESCEHIFCLDCITEWSKNVNTCPVDRMSFNSIVVRACAGGRVVRTEQVKVNVRRSSVDALITEQSEVVCEVCGSMEDEETLLLCDGCDHGYHMRCLTPPLSEIPRDQWHCPNCVSGNVTFNRDNDFLDNIPLSEVEDLIDDIGHEGLRASEPRPSPLRLPRNVHRSPRIANRDQPSTSSGRHSNSVHINEVPTTSRAARRERAAVPAVMRRRTATKRRKYKRRRTKTVIIEYEIQGNGKFPITKKVKRKIKRRRVKKRQPRTAARRSYVRASVRAKLETLRTNESLALSQAANAIGSVQQLSVRRQRAGVPILNIFGNPNELDYFSDEDNAISEEASTAVATRTTSNIFSAYRQTRRKMVTIPSPSYAASAPDILSNILESQTLLHSKQSIITVSVDGNVDYKLQSIQRKREKNNLESSKEKKIDLMRANEAVKNAPLHPGQNRGSGGGGWGGGYRGNYHRDQNSNNFNNRGANYDNNNYGGGYPSRQGNNYNNNNNYQNNTMRHDETEYYDNFQRRPHQYSHNEDSHHDRSRRPLDNRGNNYPNHHRPNDQNQGRYSLGQSWSPFGGTPAHGPRHEVPPAQSRHSFGGFENPVDMRMGQMSQSAQVNEHPSVDMFPVIGAPHQEKPQPQSYQSLPEPSQAYQPLSQPPVFNFQKLELERSEDEKSDSGLIIDTEKYDPTEPTNDDDSGDDDRVTAPVVEFTPAAPPSPPSPPPPPPPLPPPPAVQSTLAGIDTSAMNVPSNILDSAVRQVLKEHRNLISSPRMEPHNYRSDDDSDGDCPNFSIYSATSVHIANITSTLTDDIVTEPFQDNLEDLVQEDDETPTSISPVIPPDINFETKTEAIKTPSKSYPNYDSMERKKTEEEYKEKVSKRCPITTNTRNPIKIKLNTPSLIKRQVTLYDEEENSIESETDEAAEQSRATEPNEQKSNSIVSTVGKVDENRASAPDTCASNVESTTEDFASSSPSRQNQNKFLEPINKFSSESFQIVDVSKNDRENNKDDQVEDQDELLNEIADTCKPTETTEDASDNNEDSYDEREIDNPEIDIAIEAHSPSKDLNSTSIDDNVEKMTESISETEDERSYTPCLDENKSNKDTSLEMDKDKGLEGLDTEMISEEEGNDMFSENERPPSETETHVSPPRQPAGSEEGEISDKKEKKESKKSGRDDTKKKKKKDSKKEGKDKTKNKKKNEISFKKLSKSGKERNYRERDKDEKKGERERRDSGENESRNRRRKEKRKDLERYDVRTIVTEKRRKQKDPFGRDISPRDHSPSLSPPPRSSSLARRRSPSLRRSPSRLRRTPSRGRQSISKNRRSISRPRRSLSRIHRSLSRPRRSPSRGRRSISRARRSISKVRGSPSRRSISRGRKSPVRKSIQSRITPVRGRSPSRPRVSPIRARRSPPRRSGTPRLSPRRRSPTRRKRRRSTSRAAARRRSASGSPPRRTGKKKKRTRSARRAIDSSVDRKRKRSSSHQLEREPSPPSRAPSLRPPSPRTPPPGPIIGGPGEEERRTRRRRDPERLRRRARELTGPSKEVFTSGDNILVSVSFKDQERGEEGERRRRRESRRERRRRRRAAAAPETEVVKPVAIIDLDRSPFRELTPSPKNVIVLSDSDHGERESTEVVVSAPIVAEPQPEPAPPTLGPKTPPEPVTTEVAPESDERAPEPDAGPGSETHSPDAYDPFEPTRSPSASPASASPAPAAPPSPPRALITLEAAQRSNMSADEVLDRRPLTPVEKVLALLQSTREVSPEGVGGGAEPEAPPVMAAAPRIVLPSPTRSLPKLFPGKPSPIKSNPVKPMQALRLPRLPALPSDGGASPYSPGSSDFGELFEPPTRRSRGPAKVPIRLDRKKASKTHVGVKVDEENLKVLDDLPNSAVEMQVKSKFLKKLNRQERVVEEVKLVLKPHYNKKRVTKEEYKDILRRAVPKICHNKSGEINPTKIQALVEAYVKKFRKKHKLGVVA